MLMPVFCAECNKIIAYASSGNCLPYIICAECNEEQEEHKE